jgi:metacaspase-1
MAKKAVLIGVNKYRIPGADLRGCVNDVKNIQKVLVKFYGFADGDITVLTDSAATKKKMEAAIRKLVRGARKGDALLLHFSGHGSNVPDNDGDEADRRDEILCPTDLDWKKPMRDDWLRKIFDGLASGVSLTVIMDCCHSGTNTRAINPPDAPVVQRYLPSPWDLVAAESGRRPRGRIE